MIMPDLTLFSNGCSSGILYPKSFYGRIGLATPAALEYYKLKPALRRKVTEAMAVQLPIATFFERTAIIVFLGRRPEIVSVGLFQQESSHQDYSLFLAARRFLSSSEPGIHRRVILGIVGVETTERIADLPKTIYEAMLAEIANEKPGGLTNVAAVDCAERAFHQGIQEPEGQRLVFSRALLERSTDRTVMFLAGSSF
jgi:hypothetical protein